MKKIWKWILGILIVLIVVAGLVGLVFVVRNRMIAANFPGYGFQAQQRGNVQPQGGNTQPRGWGGPMMRGGNAWGGPMMGGRGFGYSHFGRMPFGFLFGGLMQLIPLAFLALVVFAAYQIGKNSARPAVAAIAPAPVIATHACSKCGTAVQDGSRFCPECGRKQ